MNHAIINRLKNDNCLKLVNISDIKKFQELKPEYSYFYQRGQNEIPKEGYLALFRNINEYSILPYNDSRIEKYELI